MIGTAIGILLFHFAAFGCFTFYNQDSSRFFGYWGVYEDGSCYRYGEPYWRITKVGRAIGVLGALVAWATVAVLAMAPCYKFQNPKRFHLLTGISMCFVSFFSLLLLIEMATEDDDTIGVGGGVTIISGMVWAGCAIGIFYCRNKCFDLSTTTGTSATANVASPK